ncbi:MAG: NACHT domain-containing protein [Saprospiraceae bacterium]|nr:NACHT domain-containing protein [Saprospiraceae bacterium]
MFCHLPNLNMQDIQASIEIGIDLFKDLIFASWKAVSGLAKEKYQENDPFGIATRKYIGGLIERYNLVKVLGMREPVPLKSLYVRANILEKISARAGLRPEELAEFFDFDRRAFGKKSETVDGEIIVNRLQKFIVLGKPGAGKTTYLKFLTLMMLDPMSQIEQRRLPVFVTLREWADEKVPLMDFIVSQFDICGFPEARLFLEKMLAEGKCLVLFDGLDEVSQESNLDDIIRQIQNFTDKYSDNQFVISCRVAAYNHWFERFTDVEMADFNEEQMETFIRNWFHGEPKVATECWERLKASAPLKELASVPLLLTLLCLEYSESNDFPPNRAELYERAIETLLTKWDSSRRIRRAEVYKQLSLKRKESMFARIAFATFTQNEYFIRERVLAKMIEKYIEHLPGFNPAELEPDSRAVLQAIASQHGIFVERAKDVYSFAHLTFQEYFTARYVVDNQWKKVDRDGNLDENGAVTLIEYVVEKYLYEAKWKEVFLLVSGMLDDANELLLLMKKKANEVLEEQEINGLFLIIKNSLGNEINQYSNVIRKTFALFIIFTFSEPYSGYNTLTRTYDYAIIYVTNYAFALAYALGHAPLLTLSLVKKTPHLKRFQHLALSASIALDILYSNSRSNKIDNQTAVKIIDYLSANTLIIQCLSSGAYLSNPIRQKLIHEIFMTKEELEQGGFEQDL